ncbi:SWIM zinc finger family protein [Haladaptatus sp. DFWS20]|uniref:SWIM zinc finger family protein n=1 Tax=Haladaptatus sp. DFWS20 TaxID=3403467 RepID=UPI003EBE37A3
MFSENHVLSHLTYSKRVAKRAQYEALEFTVDAGGVRVQNASHANPADHEYLVTIRDGIPDACECPADEHFEGACKHRVAVAIRVPVLRAAIDQQVAADGGRVDDGNSATTEERITDEDCECAGLDPLPCWECVRNGRKELPET